MRIWALAYPDKLPNERDGEIRARLCTVASKRIRQREIKKVVDFVDDSETRSGWDANNVREADLAFQINWGRRCDSGGSESKRNKSEDFHCEDESY